MSRRSDDRSSENRRHQSLDNMDLQGILPPPKVYKEKKHEDADEWGFPRRFKLSLMQPVLAPGNDLDLLIRVESAKTVWDVKRKFSELQVLGDMVRKKKFKGKLSHIPKFPKDKFDFNNMPDRVLELLRIELERFIQMTCCPEILAQNHDLRSWLGMNETGHMAFDIGINQRGIASARAIAPYDEVTDLQLSFKKGDIIVVTEMPDDKPYWKGKIANKAGYFPKNLVQILTDARSSTVSLTASPVVSNSSSSSNSNRGSASASAGGASGGGYNRDSAARARGNGSAAPSVRDNRDSGMSAAAVAAAAAMRDRERDQDRDRESVQPSRDTARDSKPNRDSTAYRNPQTNYTSNYVSISPTVYNSSRSTYGAGAAQQSVVGNSATGPTQNIPEAGTSRTSNLTSINRNSRQALSTNALNNDGVDGLLGVGDMIAGKKVICLAKAIYEYEGRTEREHSFQEGDIIPIVKNDNNDWWHGVVRGKINLVPRSYVEELEDKKLKPGAVPVIKNQFTFTKDAADVDTEEGDQESDNPSEVPPEAEQQQAHQANEDETYFVAKALYSFAASKDDELSIEEGEDLSVRLLGDGWAYGTNSKGLHGIFPETYIEIKPNGRK